MGPEIREILDCVIKIDKMGEETVSGLVHWLDYHPNASCELSEYLRNRVLEEHSQDEDGPLERQIDDAEELNDFERDP
ncbi:MAG: hypothetical protein KGL39_16455 [Patescibacteria group bacterium]|nr:hypothetical protein [Patescibacteria group bacterium]